MIGVIESIESSEAEKEELKLEIMSNPDPQLY